MSFRVSSLSAAGNGTHEGHEPGRVHQVRVLADAAPGKGNRGRIGYIVIALCSGDTVKGKGLGKLVFFYGTHHIGLAQLLGNLCKSAVAGVGKGTLQRLLTVGCLAGYRLAAILDLAVAAEGLVLNVGNILHGRRQ